MMFGKVFASVIYISKPSSSIHHSRKPVCYGLQARKKGRSIKLEFKWTAIEICSHLDQQEHRHLAVSLIDLRIGTIKVSSICERGQEFNVNCEKML